MTVGGLEMSPEEFKATLLDNPFSLAQVKKWTRRLLLFKLPPFKPRKTTYKTLRYDCAKRNGRR